jgi:hypothetical protein
LSVDEWHDMAFTLEPNKLCTRRRTTTIGKLEDVDAACEDYGFM